MWLAELGDAVPLQMVPDVLGVSPAVVRQRIEKGTLKVHTFKSVDGRVRRYVTVRELRAHVVKPKLTLEKMRRALTAMTEQR